MPESVKGVEQMPIHGTSMRYSFDAESADRPHGPSPKQAQYFEMFGHRGIWADGWKAVTYHESGRPLDDDRRSYHLDNDFSECHDLAASCADKLEKFALFWQEAEANGVLPIESYQRTGLFAGNPTFGTPREAVASSTSRPCTECRWIAPRPSALGLAPPVPCRHCADGRQ